MVGLKFRDLTKLINEPITYNAILQAKLAKLPFDIRKFERKFREDPTNHFMSFYLWFASNKIIEDIIYLHLFQSTLTGPIAKLYVNERHGTYTNLKGFPRNFYPFSIPLLDMTLG